MLQYPDFFSHFFVFFLYYTSINFFTVRTGCLRYKDLYTDDVTKDIDDDVVANIVVSSRAVRAFEILCCFSNLVAIIYCIQALCRSQRNATFEKIIAGSIVVFAVCLFIVTGNYNNTVDTIYGDDDAIFDDDSAYSYSFRERRLQTATASAEKGDFFKAGKISSKAALKDFMKKNKVQDTPLVPGHTIRLLGPDSDDSNGKGLTIDDDGYTVVCSFGCICSYLGAIFNFANSIAWLVFAGTCGEKDFKDLRGSDSEGSGAAAAAAWRNDIMTPSKV